MQFFSKNIKFLRKSKGYTQAEIKDRLDIEPTTWSNYEREKSVPNLELFHRISQFFGVSETDILNIDISKGGTFEKLTAQKSTSKGGIKGGNTGGTGYLSVGNFPLEGKEIPPFLPAWQDEDYIVETKNNVFDLTSKAAAGTIVHMVQERDKFRTKPNLYLPGLGPGLHIRVPVGGDSMHNTIKDGDKPVATLIMDRDNIRPGHVYLLLDKDDGLVCKRIYWEDSDTMELVSDNDVYAPYTRHLNDILAVFKVREVHTRDLRPYFNDLRKEMREIKAEMAVIRRKLA